MSNPPANVESQEGRRELPAKPPLFRPLQLTVVSLALIVVLVFVVLITLTLVSERRARHAIDSAERLQAISEACQIIERAGVAPVQGPDETRDQLVEEAAASLTKLSNVGDAETKSLLASASRTLRKGGGSDVIQGALYECSLAASHHQSTHVDRMVAMRGALDQELSIALIAPVVMLGLLAAVVYYTRSRIFEPMRALGALVSRLSEGQRKQAAVGNVDPSILPLYVNYNRLVSQLEQLEAVNRAHAQRLTEEVHAATKALLNQQKSLARAETLAAVGEVAASVAHELRNPLAGIQMTLSNLQGEVADEEVRERLGLVSAEVVRMGRLLEGLLSQARHTPEAPRDINLADTVSQLLALTTYQLPEKIKLSSEVPPSLVISLPEDRLRQALLNLILNSADAAAKHGSKIVVRAEETEDSVRLSVTDDGPGFPDSLLHGPKVPFSTTRAAGTGLGLAIVRRFVRDAGGRLLELENQSPKGARATMSLPSRGKNG